MLEFIIHSMEACVVLLGCVIIYRVKNLTHRYYQMELLGDEQLHEIDLDNISIINNENNMLRKLLKGSPAKSNQSYDTKICALQQSQIFASTQLVNIKRQFGDLNDASLKWLREASAFYLIGAIKQVTIHEHCDADDIEEITLLTLKSSLNISKEESYQYHYKALRNSDDIDLHKTVKAGEEAVSHWLNGEIIPSNLSLSKQLENWGVIA